jgi:aromatic-L-amino-acid decarboxylase
VDSSDFELMAPVTLSIACFRFHPKGFPESGLDDLNLALAKNLETEGHFFLTGTKIHGKVALRACCINHRADNAIVVELLRHVTQLAQAAFIHSNWV